MTEVPAGIGGQFPMQVLCEALPPRECVFDESDLVLDDFGRRDTGGYVCLWGRFEMPIRCWKPTLHDEDAYVLHACLFFQHFINFSYFAVR